MPFRWALTGVAAGLLLASSPASATCTKPLNGVFVGSGSGASVSRLNGATVNLAAISLSVTISSTGSMSIVEIGKSYTSGDYSLTYTVASTANTFNTTTCQGQVTTSRGQTYVYTSATSGNVVTFIYYLNDSYVGVYNLRLERA